MDDAGSEHAGGWVLVRDGLIAAVGSGEEPESEERLDLGGALVTPGLVNTHHHLYQTLTRARAAGLDALRMARRALSGVGASRRRGRVRRGAHRPGRARALGLLDRVRPPLRLPARPQRHPRGRAAGSARAGPALRRLARLDGSRRLARRPPSRLAGGDARRDPDRHRARRSAGRRRPAADRCRTLLAVLGHASADGRVCRARTAPRPAAAHAPGRDGRRGRVLPRALRLHARRVPDRRRLAG